MLRAIGVALVVASCVQATAREFPVIPQPIVLRLTGRITPDRASARVQHPDVVGMQIGDAMRWLGVERSITLGDHPVSGRTVLNMLEPFQDGVLVVGATPLQQKLLGAPPGAILTIEGLFDRGARTYLLRDVQVAAPPPSP